MTLRQSISALLALLLLTGSAAAFTCDSYCAPSLPAAVGNASEHGAHAHHHAAAAPARPAAADSIRTANADHPPQCSMTAETPRAPRVVRSMNGSAANHLALQLDITKATAMSSYAVALAPSPPPSPPLRSVLPLRI